MSSFTRRSNRYQSLKTARSVVRCLVSGAVRISEDLVYPDDTLSDLKKVGDPSHPAVAAYIADVSFIKPAEDEDDLNTEAGLGGEVRPRVGPVGVTASAIILRKGSRNHLLV